MSKSEEHWNSLQLWLKTEINAQYKNSVDSLSIATIGETEGVYSYVARLTLSFHNGEQEQLIAKIPTVEKYVANRKRRNWTAGNSNSFLGRLKELHNKEVFFYNNIPDVSVIPKSVVHRPMEDGNEGILVMKCIPNATCISICDSFTENQMKEIIQGYAELQVAASTLNEDQKRILDTGLLEGVLSTTLSKENIVKRLGIISSSYPSLSNVFSELSEKFDVSTAIAQFNEEKVKWTMFLHGDLHNTNILLQNGTFASFIDFQTIHYGNPCEDLIRLVCLGSYPKRLLETKNLVLEQYCKEMQKYSVAGTKEMTVEDMTMSYNKMLPLCGMWALISLHAAYDHAAHGDTESESAKSEEKFINKMDSITKTLLHDNRI